jgi:hypothetical protein
MPAHRRSSTASTVTEPATEGYRWVWGTGLSAQVLTVSSNGGEVHAFLAALPTLHAAHQARMVYLTSLLELSVVDVLTEQRWAVSIDAEPAFLALGPAHLATGMNNQVCVCVCVCVCV